MRKDRKDPEVKFTYEGKPPPTDLLNYKNMMLTERRWAATDPGWSSVLGMALLMLLCVGSMLLLSVLRYG